MIPVTRVEITPGTAGSFQDVNVASHVGGDTGSIALVMLEVVNNSGTERTWALRKNGSSDTLEGILEDTGHTWIAIGVDSSENLDIFEMDLEDITDIDVYLVGYATTAEAGNLTNAVQKTVSVDVDFTETFDISADTGGDTALCAFFKVKNTAGSAFREHGLQLPGETTDATADVYNQDLVGAASACDGSEVIEAYAEVAANISWWLTCWLTDNFTAIAWVDKSTGTTGSNVDVDVSAQVPSGNDGAFFRMGPITGGGSERKALLIKKGSGITEYQDLAVAAYPWVELDGDRMAEQKIEATSTDLYIWGYTSQPAAADVTVTPGVIALITALFAPIIKLVVTPGVVALGTSAFAPSVVIGTIVTPPTLALSLSTFAPTVTATDNQLVTPPTQTLSLSTFAPTVTATGDVTVTPGVVALSLSVFVPVIKLAVIPPMLALSLATFAPIVVISGKVIIVPGLLTLSLGFFAPTVFTPRVVTPGVLALSLTTLIPTITIVAAFTAVWLDDGSVALLLVLDDSVSLPDAVNDETISIKEGEDTTI